MLMLFIYDFGTVTDRLTNRKHETITETGSRPVFKPNRFVTGWNRLRSVPVFPDKNRFRTGTGLAETGFRIIPDQPVPVSGPVPVLVKLGFEHLYLVRCIIMSGCALLCTT